jgi:hypothetical protein
VGCTSSLENHHNNAGSLICDSSIGFRDCIGKRYHSGMTVPKLNNQWTTYDHKVAMLATKEYMKKVLEKAHPPNSANDKSSSDEDAPYAELNQPSNPRELNKKQSTFIGALQSCIPLYHGFGTSVNSDRDKSKFFCLCSQAVKPWRFAHDLDDDKVFNCKKNKVFKSSQGMIDHLRTQGGGWKESGYDCFYHYAAFVYLRILQKQWKDNTDMMLIHDGIVASFHQKENTAAMIINNPSKDARVNVQDEENTQKINNLTSKEGDKQDENAEMDVGDDNAGMITKKPSTSQGVQVVNAQDENAAIRNLTYEEGGVKDNRRNCNKL